jgi:hypothetical protein
MSKSQKKKNKPVDRRLSSIHMARAWEKFFEDKEKEDGKRSANGRRNT